MAVETLIRGRIKKLEDIPREFICGCTGSMASLQEICGQKVKTYRAGTFRKRPENDFSCRHCGKEMKAPKGMNAVRSDGKLDPVEILDFEEG